MNTKLLKLAKMMIQFSEVETDKGILTSIEQLAEGVEVFIADENGEFTAAPDDVYETETQLITVKDGKVEKIEDKTVEETPVDEEETSEGTIQPEEIAELADENPEEESQTEQEPDEKDLRIKELEGLLQDRDAVIEELTAKIKELEDKTTAPVEEPVKMKTQVRDSNPVLKYFER